MTRRRDLERHRHSLAEIREILNSMKTLAYMETRKLSAFLAAQQAVVASLEEVAADFLAFHPDILPAVPEPTPVFLLIGSERGFCGDFNHELLLLYQEMQAGTTATQSRIITVGRKLNNLAEATLSEMVQIDGAGVVEDVTSLIGRVVECLDELRHAHGALSLQCLYHEGERGTVARQLMPPFTDRQKRPCSGYPPLLHQTPSRFLSQLTEQYLFAALFEMWYASLMAENRRRVAHLEGAARHLDEEAGMLLRKSNAMRQEEIVEEIEVILLSAENPQRKLNR